MPETLASQSCRRYANLHTVKTIQPGLLDEAVGLLRKEFQPEEIYLFGKADPNVLQRLPNFGTENLEMDRRADR